MTSEQQTFDLHLTPNDVRFYTRIWQLCREKGVTEFTSDTIRDNGLASNLTDKLGRINVGAPLARLQYAKLIEVSDRKNSTTKGNHDRKVTVYKFKGMQP